MKQQKALFFVFEGGEGSGKTTLAKHLAETIKKKNLPVLLTKEPGGDEAICADIRKILLNPGYQKNMADRAELMLFLADRAEHVAQVIRPALQSGTIVISDRFSASTFSYQCVARSVCTLEEFKKWNEFVTTGLEPTFTIWTDVDPAVGLERNVRQGKRDRFEAEAISFHKKVRAGFEQFFENIAKPDTWIRLESTKDGIPELQTAMVSALQTRGFI